MQVQSYGFVLSDHCRIGSLEIWMETARRIPMDHCRIGSLEIVLTSLILRARDHCRIGSLESTCYV